MSPGCRVVLSAEDDQIKGVAEEWKFEVGRGLAIRRTSGSLSLPIVPRTDPMTNRVSYAPQDFQKMCKQAERDHETKKLASLMERLKRQIAERSNPGFKVETGKAPANAVTSDSGVVRLPIRSVPLER